MLKINYIIISILTFLGLFLNFQTIIIISNVATNQVSVNASPSRIPAGVLFYQLNTSFPYTTFATADFTPENPHIGRYSIRVEVMIFIDGLISNTDLIIHNLWNACDIDYVMDHERGSHESFHYTYHRPSVSYPDFIIGIELYNSNGKTSGWVYIAFIDDGVLSLPYTVIMPSEQNCSTAATSFISTGEKSSTSDGGLSFPILSSIVYLVVLVFISKYFFNNRKID
ncbi:MAG: hypothetical protein ACFFCQ_17075 [Promethearchaeota archaeon]